MNSHLNIFKTYTNTNRTYQLENDLTRALAISLQEDPLFFHEILKEILKDSNFYNLLFESSDSETVVNINIQPKASQIPNYNHLFAISLSESEIADFWEQNHNEIYDPICDLVIQINDILLIFEAKRDSTNCTAQLYNQILNINKLIDSSIDFNQSNFKDKITPFDLNWKSLMAIAVKVLNFEKTMNTQNRFLSDFISLVKDHNFRWLPDPCIASLSENNAQLILRRVELAINELDKTNQIKKLNYFDRLGIELDKPWAKEILFSINELGNLVVCMYPGNTKSQGYSLFQNNININKNVIIQKETYSVNNSYHIKFTSFQKYFQGLWFNQNQLKKELYSLQNFISYTGRKKRGKDWEQIETIFDECLNFNWRKECNWENAVLNSGKSQLDLSFGYEIYIEIPFFALKQLDIKESDLRGLMELIIDIDETFKNKIIVNQNNI
ncbi:hypothetical protein V3Q77_03010 [Flavobacterium davisii]|uniref:PD-(D/E)XK nuclease superfamily protein n=1 Tax=Flavobacterium davisii TaxID=2906077 RepID=A0ABW8PLN1_9FLAO